MWFDIQKLLSEYNSFDPFEICKQKNINIRFKDIERPKGDTIYLFNNPVIILSDKIRYSPERYFVCAHELSHILLHNGLHITRRIILHALKPSMKLIYWLFRYVRNYIKKNMDTIQIALKIYAENLE